MIAIIAILAGLLLPALNKAKSKAQGIKCLANVKALNLCWSMYADDNNDRLVPNGNPVVGAPAWILGSMTVGFLANPPLATPAMTNLNNIKTGNLYKYITGYGPASTPRR